MQNDLLLDADKFGIADFHTKVATRHHHRVAGADQAVEGFVVGHCFGAFDLRHQPGAAAGFLEQAAGVFHVLGVAREGDCDVVQIHARGQFDVGLVLLGQRRRGQAAATAVDALVVGQRAADQHAAAQFVSGDFLDAHYHAAVVQQQFVTDAAVLDQVRIVDADHVLGAGVARMAGGEAEGVAYGQFDALVGELGDADLRALQVAEQGDEAAVLGGQFAYQLGAGAVLVGGSVGEVQAGDVDAGDDELFEDLRGVAGWAKGGDDLGAARCHSLLLV
ncbi:hypothetical protein D9M71_284260 [compost metagenome]